MNRVEGKIALVFGGGQTPGQALGNGRATCLVLAREGAQVIVVDRDLASAQETAEMIREAQGHAQALQADQTQAEQVSALVQEVHARHGRIDLLHNNVGASLALGDAVASDIEEAALDRSFAVNFKSAWLASKAVLPLMREQGSGSIINISSIAAIQAYPLLGYKTTKAAMIAMTENMAAANARYGVRINTILPGLMHTAMAIEARVKAGWEREAVTQDRDRRVPLRGKMGTAWDVANAALFLHSDEASFITGASLVVDGGETVAHGH